MSQIPKYQGMNEDESFIHIGEKIKLKKKSERVAIIHTFNEDKWKFFAIVLDTIGKGWNIFWVVRAFMVIANGL